MSFPVIIAGSQDLQDYDLLKEKCDQALKNYADITIMVATERGTVPLAIKYAKEKGFQLKVFKTDFQAWGQLAKMHVYRQMIPLARALIFFWNGESSDYVVNLCKSLPTKVYQYKSFKQELKEAEQAERAANKGRKKITVPITKQSRDRYIDAHKQWFIKTSPAAYKDGFYTPVKVPIINAGSRMDTFIINFLVWSGWNATKINIMGRKINGKWVASTTKKGSQDIAATIKGRSVRIETKHNSDTVKKHQLEMQERERAAGGISEVVHSIEDFFVLYDKIILSA